MDVQEFAGKVAVVTGAASGIGRALALRFAAEGMSVALADVEEAPLRQVESEVAAAGSDALAVVVDVASRSAVLDFAAAVRDRFGPPHVLCNNAGVSGGGGPIQAVCRRPPRVANMRLPCVSMTPLARPVVPEV